MSFKSSADLKCATHARTCYVKFLFAAHSSSLGNKNGNKNENRRTIWNKHDDLRVLCNNAYVTITRPTWLFYFINIQVVIINYTVHMAYIVSEDSHACSKHVRVCLVSLFPAIDSWFNTVKWIRLDFQMITEYDVNSPQFLSSLSYFVYLNPRKHELNNMLVILVSLYEELDLPALLCKLHSPMAN